MVRVTTTETNPFYLRFAVADQVTANGFRARVPQGGQPAGGGLPDPTIQTAKVTQRSFQARVEVLNFQMPLLPLYSTPSKIQGLNSRWLYDPAGGQLYSSRENSAGKRYTFDYVRTEYPATRCARYRYPRRTTRSCASTPPCPRRSTYRTWSRT